MQKNPNITTIANRTCQSPRSECSIQRCMYRQVPDTPSLASFEIQFHHRDRKLAASRLENTSGFPLV